MLTSNHLDQPPQTSLCARSTHHALKGKWPPPASRPASSVSQAGASHSGPHVLSRKGAARSIKGYGAKAPSLRVTCFRNHCYPLAPSMGTHLLYCTGGSDWETKHSPEGSLLEPDQGGVSRSDPREVSTQALQPSPQTKRPLKDLKHFPRQNPSPCRVALRWRLCARFTTRANPTSQSLHAARDR